MPEKQTMPKKNYARLSRQLQKLIKKTIDTPSTYIHVCSLDIKAKVSDHCHL